MLNSENKALGQPNWLERRVIFMDNHLISSAPKILLTREQRRFWWTITLGFFAAHLLSYSFTNIAPAFYNELGFSMEQYGRLHIYFYWGLALGALLGGLAAKRWGFKHAWLGWVTLFSLAFPLGALGIKPLQLLLLRFLSGIGIMGMTIAGLSALAHILPPAKRGRYLILSFAVATLATPIGPLLANALLSGIGWRWCMALSSISLLLLPAGHRYLPSSALGSQSPPKAKEAQVPIGQFLTLLLLFTCALHQLTGGGFSFMLPAIWPKALAIILSLLSASTLGYLLVALASGYLRLPFLLGLTAGLGGLLTLLRCWLLKTVSTANIGYLPLEQFGWNSLMVIPLTILLAAAAYGFSALCWAYAVTVLPRAMASKTLGTVVALAFLLAWPLRELSAASPLNALLFFTAALLAFMAPSAPSEPSGLSSSPNT